MLSLVRRARLRGSLRRARKLRSIRLKIRSIKIRISTMSVSTRFSRRDLTIRIRALREMAALPSTMFPLELLLKPRSMDSRAMGV